MASRAQIARHVMNTALATFLFIPVRAQAPSSVPAVGNANFPVGRWIAEHPSKGGIASWWEFRPDGTVTLYFGVMVSDQLDRSGNTFTMPSGMAGGERVRATYRINDDVLSIQTTANHSTNYARIGMAPNPNDLLIGDWRPLPSPADAGSAPNLAVMQKLMTTKGVLSFTPDGMRHLRAPFGTKEGTWDSHANTFRIEGDPGTYSFGFLNGKLLLAQPPNGKEMDSYVPDPLSALVTNMLPRVQTDATSGTPGATAVSQSGPDIIRPKIMHAVEASYSKEARKRKIRGTVRLEVIVEADGHIRSPRVIQSAADAYTDPADREAARTLDQKAIEAVNQYTFAAGTLHGKPVPLAVTVEVDFQLL